MKHVAPFLASVIFVSTQIPATEVGQELERLHSIAAELSCSITHWQTFSPAPGEAVVIVEADCPDPAPTEH